MEISNNLTQTIDAYSSEIEKLKAENIQNDHFTAANEQLKIIKESKDTLAKILATEQLEEISLLFPLIDSLIKLECVKKQTHRNECLEIIDNHINDLSTILKGCLKKADQIMRSGAYNQIYYNLMAYFQLDYINDEQATEIMNKSINNIFPKEEKVAAPEALDEGAQKMISEDNATCTVEQLNDLLKMDLADKQRGNIRAHQAFITYTEDISDISYENLDPAYSNPEDPSSASILDLAIESQIISVNDFQKLIDNASPNAVRKALLHSIISNNNERLDLVKIAINDLCSSDERRKEALNDVIKYQPKGKIHSDREWVLELGATSLDEELSIRQAAKKYNPKVFKLLESEFKC